MEKHFDFARLEQSLYAHWENLGIFNPKENDKETFSVVIPPPNVTGKLHMGHALNVSLQDILIRYKKMQGFETAWIPGTDHAGIATQNVVEKQLASEGLKRQEIDKDTFLEKVWAWKEAHGNAITQQIRRLGGAISWDYERFTLDENYEKAVRYHFVSLYKKGLIYKGKRITNWCPVNQTAISDIEVNYEEKQGHLYTLHYPLTLGEKDGISIATTRPETLFGDLAIAVHPDDSRYQHLLGKAVLIPILNKGIPVIADKAVDPDYGTGAVKVTPAHDPNDFEIGARHQLGHCIIMDANACMINVPTEYEGLDRYACRKKLVADLEAQGQLLAIKEISHAVGISSRSGAVIEPLLSEQWFIDMKKLVGPAIEAVKKDAVEFFPQRWKKGYFDWMENIQDWCISRQIWWGHSIPVWSKGDEIYCDMNAPEGEGWVQESDVLDTWFSSALWPFATLGWPEKSKDLKRFYPTSCLVTGYDIITFWVSRMITMGIEQTQEKPFKDVYIHGLVRDSSGKKMSKSLGNAVNPLDLIQDFGADALRLSLARSATLGGQDISFHEDKVKACRNFTNKIWNLARYLELCLEGQKLALNPFEIPKPANSVDAWILSKTSQAIQNITEALDSYNFALASDTLWHFCWDEVCDWYIELSKNNKAESLPVLSYVVFCCLKLCHPFIPFISDTIFLSFKKEAVFEFTAESLFECEWPQLDHSLQNATLNENFESITGLIRDIRNTCKENQLSLKNSGPLYLKSEVQASFSPLIDVLSSSLQSETIQWIDQEPKSSCLSGISGPFEYFIEVSSDFKENERKRLQKQIENLETEIKHLTGKLNNKKFVENAPKELVAKSQEKLANTQNALTSLQDKLKSLA